MKKKCAGWKQKWPDFRLFFVTSVVQIKYSVWTGIMFKKKQHMNNSADMCAGVCSWFWLYYIHISDIKDYKTSETYTIIDHRAETHDSFTKIAFSYLIIHIATSSTYYSALSRRVPNMFEN